MKNEIKIFILALTVCLSPLIGLMNGAQEKPIQPGERETARSILNDLRQDVLKNYYDPKFRGIDVESRFKEADERIKKATSLNQALGIVAWALEGLHDSHTFFIPPPRPYRLDYGWTATMVGDQCLVTAIKPGSDAEQKGLHPGDLIEAMNTVKPSRQTYWSVNYLFKLLRPQPGFELVVVNPQGERRTVGVAAKVQQGKRVGEYNSVDFGDDVREAESAYKLMQRRSYTIGDDVIIWKLPSFTFDEKGADALFGESRKFKAVILDLRQDPGGFEVAALRMIGNMFEKDVKVGNSKTRRGLEPLVAKTRGDKAFPGKIFILIDSGSASASEILARVVQLEKRGVVLGDTSSGSLMSARIFAHRLGFESMVFYVAAVSEADIIMSDGKSLEGTGVVPDETILPTANDLANQRDPVLSRAVTLAGAKLSPEEAGKLFPIQWPK